MKRMLFIIGLVLLLVLAVVSIGCVEQVRNICEPPYVRQGLGCCIDQNGDGKCDVEQDIGNLNASN